MQTIFLRGYMDLCENLKGLGAEIEWETVRQKKQ